MANEYEIPVADSSFDVVLAGQVLEHVRRVWMWVAELARVTKPGGKVVMVSPISWPYHEAPVDCWRVYPGGTRALCDAAGLGVVTCESGMLEPPLSRHEYPGESYRFAEAHHPHPVRSFIMRAVGWPLPTAQDLITIAQKP
jgi:SAM-dependent methyltransferase